MKNRSIAIQLCLVGLSASVGYSIAQVEDYLDRPSCPEEDSCIADYDGESDSWKIIEVAR